MSKPKNRIPLDYLRACFDVDFVAGTLTWRTRPREHFASTWAWKVRNKVYPGERAAHARRYHSFAGSRSCP